MALVSPALAAVCRYDPSPGSRKSRLPSMNISQAIRKNQPPATETMEFQTRPIAPYGSSSSTKRCHLPQLARNGFQRGIEAERHVPDLAREDQQDRAEFHAELPRRE